MGIGLGVFLIAVGAILTFAVHATVSGVSIHTVGIILMIAGVIGLAVSMAIFAPRRRTSLVRERTVTAPPVATAPVATAAPVVGERVVERRDTN